MQWYWAALLLFGLGVGLMMLGIPVAIAFFATNVVAAALFMGGGPGIVQVINNGFGAMTSFALVPIPMFLLMGELFYHTGLATKCFNAADKLLGNVRGRLAYVTLIGGTAFAGPAGSSMGACALLGSLMVPEMMRRGYSKYLSIGPIMGVGGLAVIIPTEAAALGALSVIVLAACYGEMTWRALVKSLNGALRVTVMAFLIIFGSATFAQVLAFTGASSGLMNWALRFDVTPLGMLFIMIGVILFLGCFMDQLSMMLLTAPIFFPLAKTLGFDLTWFGLIMLLALEIGYTTPPFGLLLFVMKGVAPPGTTMKDIYLAGMPFIACVLLLIGLIIILPPLATWLPAMSH